MYGIGVSIGPGPMAAGQVNVSTEDQRCGTRRSTGLRRPPRPSRSWYHPVGLGLARRPSTRCSRVVRSSSSGHLTGFVLDAPEGCDETESSTDLRPSAPCTVGRGLERARLGPASARGGARGPRTRRPPPTACAVMMSSPPWRATHRARTSASRVMPRTSVAHLELRSSSKRPRAQELHRDARRSTQRAAVGTRLHGARSAAPGSRPFGRQISQSPCVDLPAGVR